MPREEKGKGPGRVWEMSRCVCVCVCYITVVDTGQTSEWGVGFIHVYHLLRKTMDVVVFKLLFN